MDVQERRLPLQPRRGRRRPPSPGDGCGLLPAAVVYAAQPPSSPRVVAAARNKAGGCRRVRRLALNPRLQPGVGVTLQVPVPQRAVRVAQAPQDRVPRTPFNAAVGPFTVDRPIAVRHMPGLELLQPQAAVTAILLAGGTQPPPDASERVAGSYITPVDGRARVVDVTAE
ncbi:hypothetical protein SCAB_41111 [Streptomyces scabiei 87.22]|uniref:Uncharacterized protein n=1 Tax=Streptomyces scabiei (strain 87.22) TaxID=680198 RepID=C9Z2H0_STRSW|nr:hypothetical protein SCAB_41111 [Streptomyces scabiei 87.22]